MKNDRQYDFDRNLEDTGKLMTAPQIYLAVNM